MKKHHVWAVGGAVAGCLVMAAWAGEKGKQEPQQITLAQVPAKPREALLKLAGQDKLLGVLLRHEEGAVAYQGLWRTDNKAQSAIVTLDGAVAETEEAVDAHQVPPSVKRAASRLLPSTQKFTYQKTSTITYTIFGSSGGQKRKVEVSAYGRPADQEGREDEHEDDSAK